MRHLRAPNDDRDPPFSPGHADGRHPHYDAPWRDDYERPTPAEFASRFGVQQVPPPPRERNVVGLLSIVGLVAVAAGVAGFAAMKLPARWTAALSANSTVDVAPATAAPSSPPRAPQSAASTPDNLPTGALANALPAATPDQSMPLREDDRAPKFDPRMANAAAAPPANTRPPVQGVTDSEISFGMAAPFSGPAREMGHQLKLGIDLAFSQANEEGGVNGRQLKLYTADDAYEPARTLNAMKELYEQHKVFGFVENYGSPTALISVPYALEHHALYFGAFTGAPSLRRDPPDRYVFNYRAGYAEEAHALVNYLVKTRKLRPQEIGVLIQQDAYGDAGWDGVSKAMHALRGGTGDVFRMSYSRNTVNVDDAIAQLRRQKHGIKAVVLVATFRAAAKFIEKTRDLYPDMIYATISGVGSTGLASELTVLGPKYADGVICTQVTPAVEGYASVTLNYKKALAKYFPGEPADYTSLEAYLTANILIEGLRRAGPAVDTESVVDALETMQNYELGVGSKVSFGPSDHQALHKVWGTQLDKTGQYHAIDLE
ncbi:putative branched-chain amino acid ABC transporter [Bradyrhizobium sp. ORS 285]|uniref:ABC transporter substrate-binding protein n=1 Tax=Bradyrhizobium sp. ORS 285 TaxID=115808 RepID=UPI0002F23B0A|nr:ABC transporter substrate-binding protein [Bradyrhizobium sp. ORS 285]SMX60894.1 putative branched-chain amino acid ABC transporter [Bradyrhizobium sp. ORS 285]